MKNASKDTDDLDNEDDLDDIYSDFNGTHARKSPLSHRWLALRPDMRSLPSSVRLLSVLWLFLENGAS